MNSALNKYNPNQLIRKRYKFFVYYLVFSLPSVVLFDWLYNLSMLNLQIGLIIKATSIIIFSFLLIIRDYKIKGFRFKKVLIYFIIINFVYSFFSENFEQNIYYSIRLLYWMLGTLVFHYLFSNKYFSIAALRKMIISTVLIASFFTINLMINSENHQNASAYLVLWCLPLLLYFKKTTIIKFLILISLASIIITIKRGAILALLISLILYFLSYLRINHFSKKILKTLRVTLIFISFIVFIFLSVWSKILIRLEDKTGSGRTELYQGLINEYINSDVDGLIFGFGINSVQEYSKKLFYNSNDSAGVAAHSDWLQFTFDFGVFGLFFMIVLNFNFLKLVFYNFKNKTNLLPIASMSYFIFILSTIYSILLSSPDAIFFGIVISVINVESRKHEILKNNAKFRKV